MQNWSHDKEGMDVAKRKSKAIDPVATLDQAATAVEAGEKDQARTPLRAYRRWRLQGNAAPSGGDERYGELVARSGPEITVAVSGSDEASSGRPSPSPESLRSLARLVLGYLECIREKYRGVEVDPVVALREAETALERGDLDAADKHAEDYHGSRVCGGEPPGGKERFDLLRKRLCALKREP
jgi:hypothetical protein